MVAIVSGNSLGLGLTSLATLGQAGRSGSAAQGRAGEQAYLNTANGNLVLQRRDGYLAGPGPDLDVLRTYNSQGALAGGTQDRWGVGAAHQRLVLTGALNTAGSAVWRTAGDGAQACYAWDPADGLYRSCEGAGAHDSIAWNAAAGLWTWTDGDTGTVEHHDAAGRLVAMADAAGNTVTFGYDIDGRLRQALSATSGESVNYDYDSGQLTQVRSTLADGSTATQVRYTYDASHRLTQVLVDLSPADGAIADGHVYRTCYAYDGASSRIASVTQSDGTRLAFTYQPVGADYKVSSVTDALGQTTSYAYDEASRRTTVVDPMGHSTTYEHDAAGQLIRLASMAGGELQTREFTYNARGDVIRITDGLGQATVMDYDTAGNQVLQRDAAGNTVTRTYTAQNQLQTQTVYLVPDPDGAGAATPGEPQTTHHVYDSARPHLLRFVLSPQGRLTEYRYDVYGQRTASLNYAGAACTLTTLTEATLAAWAASQAGDGVSRTDMAYDFRGQLQTVTVWGRADASGQGVADTTQSAPQSTTRHVYDPAGRLLQTIDATGGSRSHTYDGLGRLLSTTDALGNLTVQTYDDAHNSITQTQANGLTTTNSYDSAGRLTSTLVSGSGQQASLYFYDADDRLVMHQDPTGVRAWMLYDEAGRKVADVDGNGSLTEYVYNANNQVTQTIRHARAADLSRLVDSTGQPIKPALASVRPAASGDDQPQWSAYDSAGRLVKTVDALGAVSETFYDGASRVVAVRHYASAVVTAGLGGSPSAASIAPAADALRDRISRNFHDADGLLCATLDAEGYLVALRRDAAGRQIQRIAYATATQASLRAAGTLAQLLPAASADDIATRTLYNARGLVAGELDAEGYLTEHVYDGDGNRTQSVRYGTKVSGAATDASTVADLRPAGSAADQVSRWVYDEGNRVIQETDAEGTLTQRSYDSAGNLVRTVLAAGTSDMRTLISRFDGQGRLVGELSAEGGALLTGNLTQNQVDSIWALYGITHAYDAAGRRISTTDPNGHKTLFFHDADGRLTHTVNALGEVVESQYDVLGQLRATVRLGSRIQPTALSAGLAGTAFSDALDAIRNSALDSRVTYRYNANGTLAGSTDALGYATSYTYNTFGEQIASTVQLDAQGSDGQAFGQTVGQTVSQTVSQALTRDRRGLQVQSVEDAGGLNAVASTAYDAFGRVIRTVDANGNARTQAYDRLGRVVTTTDPLNAVRSTSYDAFDRMLTQTDALGNITRYRYDSAERSVSITTAENITVTTTHTRLGQTHSVTDGRGNTTTHAYDAHGHLRATSTALATSTSEYDRAGLLSRTTDANGNQVELSYDAAGRMLTHTVDPGGLNLVTRYGYDAQGRQISITDANGVVTELAYDLRGQLIRQTVDPGGLNLVTTYSYDGRGKTLSVTNPVGTLTQYHYDKLGRRVSEQLDPEGLNLTRSYGYDAGGNLTGTTDANGHTTLYGYDANGRLCVTVDALGGVVRQSYDAAGNLIRRVEYATPIAAGAAPDSVAASAADRVTAYAYDAAGRQILAVDALGGVTQSVYDGNGNLTRHTAYARAVAAPTATGTLSPTDLLGQLQPDSANDRTRFMAYDAANRAVFAVDAAGAVVETQYDAAGNATRSIAYANGISAEGLAANASVAQVRAALMVDAAHDRITRRVFDANNRLVYAVDSLGYVKKTRYDAQGRVTGTTGYAVPLESSLAGAALDGAAIEEALQPDGTQDRTMRFTYDAAGHVLSATDALGGTESYSYDGMGNKTSYVNQKGDTWTYAYDAAGRLSQETSAAADLVAVRQDAEGNLEVDEAHTTTAPVITRLRYDALGNLASRTEAAGRPEERTTRYEYDALGRQTRSLLMQVGVYDSAADDLVNNGAGGAATRTDSLHNLLTLTQYDTLGNAVASRDQAGHYSYKSYDKLGRVAWDIDAMGQASGYERNAFGEITRLTRHAQPAEGLNNLSARSVGTLIIAVGQPPALTDTTPAGGLPAIPGVNFQPPRLQWTSAPPGTVTTVRYKLQASAVWSDALITQHSGTDSLLIPADLPAGAYDIEIEQRDSGNLSEQRTSAAIIRDTARDRTLLTTHDRAGRVTQVTEPQAYAYDAATQQAYADAAKTTRNTYNAFGDVVRVDELDNPQTQRWSRTTHYYDQRGQLSATVDALGYVTAQAYDAAGNVVLRTEYANALQGWNPASASLAELPAPPAPSEDNRTTLTGYDRAGRKTSETRINVLTSDDGASSTRRDLVTTYGYDAVGNLTRTTDALGHSTYSYYDRLGRVLAVAEPARQDITNGATLTPLTEFKRDAHGNVVVQTQRALGAAAASDAGYTAAGASTDDRMDYAAYDRQGRQIQTTDALRASRHTSYTERGDVAKTWQSVAEGDSGNTRTLYQAHRYDALGRLTHTLDPAPDALGQRSAALVDTGVQYNAFGEITQRTNSALPGAGEYFDYDRAGRLWRTNSGDGVDRVILYDVRGRATAEIRSTGNLDLRQLSGPAAAAALSANVRRSETVYDALGRVVMRRLPEHTQTQGGVSVVHMTAGLANLLSAQVTQTTSGAAWSGTNQVDLSWTSLAGLGSGDVKIEFEYLSLAYDRPAGTCTLPGEVDTEGQLPAIHSDGVIRSITHVYTGTQADAGARLQWSDPLSGQHGGIQRMTHLVVYKKDRDGLWQKVIDQYPLGDVSNSVLVAAPQDPATSVVLEFRLSGSNDPWLTGGAVNFGEQLRFTVNALAEGSYDYQVKTTPMGASPQITATGTITLGSPPLAVITTALACGNWGEGVLAWQKPADDVVQTLRFRPAGSTGIWSTLPIGAPDAGHSGVNVFMLASGHYEYELLYSHAGELHPFAHGTGQFHVTAAQGVPPIAGLNFVADEAGGARLEWPALAGSTAQLRYKLSSSSVWLDGNGSILAAADPQTAVIGSTLAAGEYDVELTRQDAGGRAIGLATARLSIRPRIYPPVGMQETTPAYVPAYALPARNLPRIEGALFAAGSGGGWTLTWPAPPAGTAAQLRYRVASGGAWMDASALVQTAGAGALQGVGIAPGGMPPGSYDVEVCFITAGAAMAQLTGRLTVSTDTAVPAQMVDTTPLYQPAVSVAAVNLPVIGALFTANADGGWALAWPRPPAGSSVTLRYRPAGEAGQPYVDASDRIAALGMEHQQIAMAPGGLEAGNWDIELFYSAGGQRTAQAMGRLAVPASLPQAPLLALNPSAHVPAHFSVNNTTVAGTSALSEAGATAWAGSLISHQPSNAGANAQLMVRPQIRQSVDRWGNVVQVSDPRNLGWTTRYQYDANNQIVLQSQSDEQGRHDTAGVAGTAITHLYYDALGRQLGVRDANGHLNRQTWDAGGQRVQETHADGGTVQNRYDLFGDKTQTTVQTSATTSVATQYRYDKRSRLTQTTHAPVAALQVVIDGNDWRTSGATVAVTERYTWDQAGRQTSQTNGASETTRYRYDLRGNITQTTGAGISVNGHGPRTQTAWDSLGRKIAEQDANGHTATWAYNYFGRLTGHMDIGGASYAYTYNHAGQLTAQTNTRGQHLSFEYDTVGNNIKTSDHITGTVTRIAYDQAGRHVRERTSFSYQRSDGLWAETIYQDNQLAYDHLGRLVWVSDARAFVGISYDKVGNRTRIHTRALEPATGDAQVHGQAGGDLDRYYAYDAMNRQTEAEGHQITYDLAGNKTSDTWLGRKVVTEELPAQYITQYDANGEPCQVQTSAAQTRYSGVDGQSTTETYSYDALGRLTDIQRDGQLIDKRFYDAAGRIVQSGATPFGVPAQYLIALAGTNHLGQPLPGNGVETRLYVYDDQGRLQAQRTIDQQNDRLQYTLDYGNRFDTIDGVQKQVAGYDGVGNLLGYTMADHLQGVGSDYRTTYARYEGYKETQTTVTGSAGTAGSSTSQHDANGNLVKVRDTTQTANDRIFFNDAQGKVLQVTQGTHIQRQLIANGEVMGRFGEAVDDKVARGPNGEPSFTSVADFSFGFQSAAGNTPSNAPRSHVVSAGDTLQSIAQRLYGDSRMWYRIADANAVTGDDNLRPGQVLTIPPADLSTNAADTFKPYDPARIVGDTTPHLPLPPRKSSGGGLFGQVLSLVVAAIVTYLWAGAAATYFNVAMNQVSAASIAVAAGAGAAGSLAGQVVGMAAGVQDGISWKGVALGALSTGVTHGLGAVGIASSVSKATGSAFLGVAGQAAVGSALTQGMGVITGLQDKFSWQSVAASAVGAGVGQAVGGAFQNAFGSFGGMLATGLAAGMAAAVMRGGRVRVQQVAVDAFGHALGDAIVGMMNPPAESLYCLANGGDRQGLYWGPAGGSGMGLLHGRGPSAAAAAQDLDAQAWDRVGEALGLPGQLSDESWVLAAKAGAGYSLGRNPSPTAPAPAPAASGLGALEEAARSLRDDLVEAAARIRSGIGKWLPFGQGGSAPDFYPGYELGTQEGMRRFLDDAARLQRQKETVPPELLQTAKTIMSSYYGIEGASLAKSFNKWSSLSKAQADGRFDTVLNKYAPYNMISEESYAEVANSLGVDVASIKAVAEVESKGLAFVKKDMPVILFERHKFHRHTGGAYDSKYPEISNRSPGGYGSGGSAQYDKLNAAMKLDRSAALMSASWGQFQIMGENYKQAGFTGVNEFVSATNEGATRQLSIFGTFIKNDTTLWTSLKSQDWETFARFYNGSNYMKNAYDIKLQKAYAKHSK